MPDSRLPASERMGLQELSTVEVGLGESTTEAPEDARPAFVVTRTHLPAHWVDELRKTFPSLKIQVVTSMSGTPSN